MNKPRTSPDAVHDQGIGVRFLARLRYIFPPLEHPGGGHSVGIVRSRTQAMEFSLEHPGRRVVVSIRPHLQYTPEALCFGAKRSSAHIALVARLRISGGIPPLLYPPSVHVPYFRIEGNFYFTVFIEMCSHSRHNSIHNFAS
jgi:hypothetical protein